MQWLDKLLQIFVCYSLANFAIKCYFTFIDPSSSPFVEHDDDAIDEATKPNFERGSGHGDSHSPSNHGSSRIPSVASMTATGPADYTDLQRPDVYKKWGKAPHHPLAGLPLRRLKPAGLIDRHWCLWMNTTQMEVRVYLSTNSSFDLAIDLGRDPLVWRLSNLGLSPSEDNDRAIELNYTLPPDLKVPGSAIWAHVVLSHQGHSIDPRDSSYDHQMLTHRSFCMTKRARVRPPKEAVSLLGDERRPWWRSQGNDVDDDVIVKEDGDAIGGNNNGNEDQGGLYEAFLWKPTLDLRLVSQFATFPLHGIPNSISEHMSFDYTTGAYYPILYREEFWLLPQHHVVINNATHDFIVDEVPLSLSYGSISLWVWQLQTQLELQWAHQEELGVVAAGDIDGVRKIILETNPYLLAATVAVSLLHSVLNFFAFKNDVAFYNSQTDFTGISVRSLALNCFFQSVILLYLFDTDTAWVLRASSSVGLLIEYWKLAKAIGLNVVMSSGWLRPDLWRLRDTYRDNAAQTETKTYDKVAMDHVFLVVYPLAVGYSLHALVYAKHTSFYSWGLSSLVGFVYAFGFVMMMPQLFINYKLKSVAHLPWRAMSFKALNTFIDDLFAFVVKMPTLHRIACLRDDLIFVVFLYQKWIYPVDKTRVNEFGQCFHEGESLRSEEAEMPGRSESSLGSGSGDTKRLRGHLEMRREEDTEHAKSHSNDAQNELLLMLQRRFKVPKENETTGLMREDKCADNETSLSRSSSSSGGSQPLLQPAGGHASSGISLSPGGDPCVPKQRPQRFSGRHNERLSGGASVSPQLPEPDLRRRTRSAKKY